MMDDIDGDYDREKNNNKRKRIDENKGKINGVEETKSNEVESAIDKGYEEVVLKEPEDRVKDHQILTNKHINNIAPSIVHSSTNRKITKQKKQRRSQAELTWNDVLPMVGQGPSEREVSPYDDNGDDENKSKLLQDLNQRSNNNLGYGSSSAKDNVKEKTDPLPGDNDKTSLHSCSNSSTDPNIKTANMDDTESNELKHSNDGDNDDDDDNNDKEGLQDLGEAGAKQKLWTMVEDNMILDLQKKHGNKWAEMCQYLPGRSKSQIKIRFRSLSRASKRLWTEEEDQKLKDLRAKSKMTDWARIAEAFPGRTKNAVKVRFRELMDNQLGQSESLAPGSPRQALIGRQEKVPSYYGKSKKKSKSEEDGDEEDDVYNDVLHEEEKINGKDLSNAQSDTHQGPQPSNRSDSQMKDNTQTHPIQSQFNNAINLSPTIPNVGAPGSASTFFPQYQQFHSYLQLQQQQMNSSNNNNSNNNSNQSTGFPAFGIFPGTNMPVMMMVVPMSSANNMMQHDQQFQLFSQHGNFNIIQNQMQQAQMDSNRPHMTNYGTSNNNSVNNTNQQNSAQSMAEKMKAFANGDGSGNNGNNEDTNKNRIS